MTRPTLGTAPAIHELMAITCPIERAARISHLARWLGTLPGHLAQMRKAALLEARAANHAVNWIAAQVGLSPARVSQLTVASAEQGP